MINYIKNILEMTIEKIGYRKILILYGKIEDKMQQLKNGIIINNEKYDLFSIIEKFQQDSLNGQGRRVSRKIYHCALKNFQKNWI